MRKSPLLCLAVLALAVPAAHAATVIYEQSFTPGAGTAVLNGTTPTTGANNWVAATSRFQADGDLTYFRLTSIPEPGAALLGGIGMFALLRPAAAEQIGSPNIREPMKSTLALLCLTNTMRQGTRAPNHGAKSWRAAESRYSDRHDPSAGQALPSSMMTRRHPGLPFRPE